MLFFSQNSTISPMKSREYMAPEGLFGLFKMMAFVYEPTASVISRTLGQKVPSSAVTTTGTPPASFTISG